MALGISTACFYPRPTEAALESVAQMGAKVTEVFFNAPSELELSFLKKLSATKDENGIRVRSIHPFTSFAEGYILFSHCERRYDDYREFYKKYYDAAAYLGADVVVLHGAKFPNNIDTQFYADRLGNMIEDAKRMNITLAHENVVCHNGESPEFLQELNRLLDGNLKIVLDIKQAVRADFSPYDFIDKLSKNICHVHISDHGKAGTCLPPGRGKFDFKRFFDAMKGVGYDRDYVIELYSNIYDEESEVLDSFNKIKNLV